MSKEVGAGGRFDIFLDSVVHDFLYKSFFSPSVETFAEMNNKIH